MDLSLCYIKKYSSTRLIQISIVDGYYFFFYMTKDDKFLWVCGEAGGALVLFVCILSLYSI